MKNFNIKLLLVCVLAVFTLGAKAQGKAADELIALLNKSTGYWNNSDLKSYMSLYDADATMMLSSGRVGLDSIRGMYVKYYFKDNSPKQPLSYDTYQVTMLGKDYALVTGRFILQATDKLKYRTGTFSLVFVHRKDGWKILHDHSG